MNKSNRTRDGQDRRQTPELDERIVRLAPAKFSKVRADCQRIGGIPYPPYLREWDIAQEGEASVQQRLIKDRIAKAEADDNRSAHWDRDIRARRKNR